MNREEITNIPAAAPKRKNRMLAFRISEISAVDRPAQAPALAALIKRDSEEALQTVPPSHTQPVVFDSFDAVCEYYKRCGYTGTEAMQKARQLHPDLFQKLQEDSPRSSVVAKAAQPKAVHEFNQLVEKIAARDGVPRTMAMNRARREHPDMFTAYQTA